MEQIQLMNEEQLVIILKDIDEVVDEIKRRLYMLRKNRCLPAEQILAEMKAREDAKRKTKKEVGLPIIIECGGVRYDRTKVRFEVRANAEL